jgi:hypothetical protein
MRVNAIGAGLRKPPVMIEATTPLPAEKRTIRAYLNQTLYIFAVGVVPAVIDGSERASAAAGPRRVRPESAAGGAAESGAEGARQHEGHLRVRDSL